MNEKRTRWLALYVLCLGDLMIVLDTNIVNVALPAIQGDLGFSPSTLAWVLNAYMLTFGGFLLLGGRLGDLLGNRRVFLGAVVAFTAASALCALAPQASALVCGRGLQGVAGAFVSALALALITALFEDPAERAKAMAFYGFVMSGGGAAGVLLGGVLTGNLGWHWVFLVNVPLGAAVWVIGSRALPADRASVRTRLDVPGAVLVTVALVLIVYAVVGGSDHGWTSAQTWGVLATGAVLLVGFVAWESRCPHPLMPLRFWRVRSLIVSQIVGMLWSAAMFATFYAASLYLQRVLRYSAIEVGLAFLPTCVVMAYVSLRWSSRLVGRFGTRTPLVVGLAMVAAGLALLAMAPVDGHYAADVLPAMLLTGLGAGLALSPVLLGAMADVDPADTGLASGLVNTSFSLGGALGLAVLVSLSNIRTAHLTAVGTDPAAALAGGYQWGFAGGAVFALVAAVVGGLLLPRPRALESPAAGEEVVAA